MKPIHSKYLLVFTGIVFLLLAFYLTRSNVRQIRRTPRPIPRQTNIEQIASWMTIPYISRIYKTPESVLFSAIGHNPLVTPNDSIEAIARREKKDPVELIKILKVTVSEAHPK